MASSGSAQDGHFFPALPNGTVDSHYASHDHLYPFEEDSQPPSPNGISAATILATLSDSRPPTSHAEHANELEEEDTETGGISLAGEWEGMTATPTTPVITHYSTTFSTFNSGWDTSYIMAQLSYANVEDHAAALEALTMEPFESVPPLPVPETFATLAPNSNHIQDAAPSAYEEHLNIQDVAAFVDITAFAHFYAASPKAGTRVANLRDPPQVIRREDLQGERCDFQGIDWSQGEGRASIRNKRMAFEKSRLLHKKWQGLRRQDRRVGVFRFRYENGVIDTVSREGSWSLLFEEPD
jgi:hypothetical protein